jgi:hypothetical protein
MFFIGIHRLGLKVDNPTKLVVTSVERGRGLNAGMNIHLVQALVSQYQPHWNDPRKKYESPHTSACMVRT